MSQSGTNAAIDQEVLYLKAIEIDLKGKPATCPIFAELKSGENARRTPRLGKHGLVKWDLESYLQVQRRIELSIRIKEVHRVYRNKDIVIFKLNIASASAIGEDITSVEAVDGRSLAKLMFVSATDELAQRLIKEAQTAVGNKKVLLESLGKASKVLDTLMKFTGIASDVHPAAKAAVGVVGLLYEQCKGQRECHKATAELMKDVASFLPFLENDGHDLVKNDGIRWTIKKMLGLFCEISWFVIEYSGKGMLRDMFSSNKDEINSRKVELERLKGAYDWSVKMEVWRSVISTESYMEDIRLQQLHPAGQAGYDIEKMCLEGTRMGVLEKAEAWAASKSKLFWLHGVAGSGKTAIANSVAHMFRGQRQLAGCFFCKRDDPECRDPKNVMPTLAYNISKWHMAYRCAVLSVIQGEDELNITKSLQWQFELLFKQLLSTLAVTAVDIPPKSLVVVIDALDECGDADSRLKLARIVK